MPKRRFIWDIQKNILDIQNNKIFDIRNKYWISERVISDIWNSFLDICMCHYFRYHKFFFGYLKKRINVNSGYLKLLFWISEIVIFDIQNNYFGYQKLCQKGVLFEISKKVILDIKNNNFGYPKINIYFRYQK